MLNRDIYQKDPSKRKLVNEGVAHVNDERTRQAMDVLRYELETFVCDGQYEKGIAHILETFLKNIDQAQQPAVWVSGFYGSGKSHLVKMLRALWVDTTFEDGATARGIAHLPQAIRDSLHELDVQARRHGGLHAVSGTLGAGASGSVRLALLRLIFKSVGLPEQYPVARFVMWLRHEGIQEKVRELVENQGCDWDEELDNFYVAESLHAALMECKPNVFSSLGSCAETLNNLYPYVTDVSSDEMLKVMRQALSKDGQIPLTLIVLDEVQQYIGENSQRSIDVQEIVEACCKNIGGKLLFIGTGQTAVTGTSNLKKLEGRFTIRVELSDADVDAVIRQVILAKKPEAIAPVEQIMQRNLGEISRHLSGTTIAHRQADVGYFAQDYPILPVRRRFWENVLRVLDQTGTDSQLRNQLSMIHKVIQTNLDCGLGNIVPADYLYFDSADKLIQSRLLPRKVHEMTMRWRKGTADEQLKSRACGLVYLISKLGRANEEIGIRATIDTLADLMIDNLSEGSGILRSRLPGLLDGCELLMKIGDEYRIQTEESSAWNDEFQSQRSILSNESHRIDAERSDRIRKRFGEVVKKITIQQGNSKVARDIWVSFDTQLPKDAMQRVCVWVRDGWSTDENSVRADARQAGVQSPTIYVFIPRRSADDLRHHLINLKASIATLDTRGVPNTPEGIEARSAMETTKQVSEGKIREFIDEAFSGARVFQSGGTEILGNDLQSMILEASQNSLVRLYSQFSIADNAGWAKVYDKAQKGATDALKAIGYDGDITQNPVCKAILAFVAGGKKGIEIREQFEAAPYGWSRDAVDGGLQILLVNGTIRALDERGQSISATELERKAIGKATFKVEATTISTAQRIQIRKVFQKMGLTVKQGDEASMAKTFVQQLLELAESAGGEAPKPAIPDTTEIRDILNLSGNDQLLAIYHKREMLSECIESWKKLSEGIEKRWNEWNSLVLLAEGAKTLSGIDELLDQVEVIRNQRRLLDEPDPVVPLSSQLTQILRTELHQLDEKYKELHRQGSDALNQDTNWQSLTPDERYELMSQNALHEAARPVIRVQSTKEVLETLKQWPIAMLRDRIAAMPARFAQVIKEAAERCEPEIQFVEVPNRMLKSEEEIEDWLNEVRKQLQTAVAAGPVWVK